MRRGARTLTIALTAAAVLVAAGAAVWWRIGQAGSTELEQWLGRQVVGIIEAHITPTVRFDDVDYQAPKTVVITGVELTSGDVALVKADRLLLELAQVPRKGEPIQIERIDLDVPTVELRVDRAGALTGWSNFVRPSDQPRPAERRLSEVLVLRHVQIRDGEVVYADASSNGVEMRLPGINLNLETEPTADEAGWYRLAGALERPPLLKLVADARANLDTAQLDVKDLKLDAALAKDKYSTLPPQLQRILQQHDVQGKLTLTWSGRIPLKSPQESSGTAHVTLEQARMSYAGVTVPIAKLAVDAELPANHFDVTITDGAVNYADRTLFSLAGLTLAARGLPGVDDAVTIEQVTLDQPHVLLARNPQGGWVGWTDLIEQSTGGGGADEDVGGDADAGTNGAGGAGFLSRFALNDLTLNNGGLTYDSAEGDEPLRLEGINLALECPPIGNRPGWNSLTATLTQEPLLEGSIDGAINFRELVVEVDELKLQAELNQSEYEKMPRRLRDRLHENELHGNLDVQGSGNLDLDQPERSDAQALVLLTDGGLLWDEKAWPIERFSLEAGLRDGRADAEFDGTLLGGDVRGSLRCWAQVPYEFDLSWKVSNLDMERTLRVMRDEEPRYAGHVSSQGTLAARFWDFPSTLNGQGDLNIDHGRLMNLPILRELVELVSKTRIPVQWPRNDTAKANFTLTPDHIQLEQADVVTALIAARGNGAIYYDSRLDLRVNAGVLERLQERLGAIGSLLGSLSDRVVTYTVKGELAQPVIGVSPLGLGG